MSTNLIRNKRNFEMWRIPLGKAVELAVEGFISLSKLTSLNNLVGFFQPQYPEVAFSECVALGDQCMQQGQSDLQPVATAQRSKTLLNVYELWNCHSAKSVWLKTRAYFTWLHSVLPFKKLCVRFVSTDMESRGDGGLYHPYLTDLIAKPQRVRP